MGVNAPRTVRGVMVLVGLGLVALLAVYATMLSTVIVGAVVIAIVLYLAYAGGYRLDRLLRGGL